MQPTHKIDCSRMDSPRSRALLEAWCSWRDGDLLPARSAMRLPDIVSLLPHITIVEAQARDSFVLRLIGTAISDVLPANLTGTNFLDLCPPQLRELRAERLWRQVCQPCGALVHHTYETESGLAFQIESLSLPMRTSDDGPLQLITVASDADKTFQPSAVRMDEIGGLPDRFAYIDIGAGVPADPVLESQWGA